MKKIGVFTSGGDAPGMNACIRAVVRTAIYNNIEVNGILYGYHGMINDMFIPMDSKSVANIIQRGGTILKTARCEEFLTKEGRKQAYDNLMKHGIEGLVCIGGNGSYTGAKIFYEEFGVPSIGLPGTIDNDLYGTDFTIGYDTAINTALQAIDKIRDTADSHDRVFLVEVMGRDSGFIAVDVGIGGGAEGIIIPEDNHDVEKMYQYFDRKDRRNKSFSIIVVAEGDKEGGAIELAKKLNQKFPELKIRSTILGHIQRGGSPTARDRVRASILGSAAVEALLKGRMNETIGITNNEVNYTSYQDAIYLKKEISTDFLRLAEILAM
jgi:6-phosphofructokinase 1